MKTPARAADPVALVFLAIAGLCAVFAYVGLSTSGYWIDELFALFLIDHSGGLAEVMRRSLTDTHPPLFYLLAYGWTQVFGVSETGARSFSATLMVASLALLFAVLRRLYSTRAAAFGVAVAASSKLFFEQSQNLRNYPLTVLLGVALAGATLAIRRRAAAGTIPAWMAAAFWAIGLAGSFTHFYLFLAVGAAHLFLLIQLQGAKRRGWVLLSGASIFAPVAAYVVLLTRGSQQDVQNMWFSNALADLFIQLVRGLTQAWSWTALGAIALLAAIALLRRRPDAVEAADPERRAAAQLSALVIVLVIAAGLTVSLAIAPSFGARNLVVLGPFFWIAAAGLYDAAAPRLGKFGGQALVVALVVLLAGNVANLRGRFLVRAEAFRESAALVAGEPACAGQSIPVVFPDLFGPPTPFFRALTRDAFFGRYYPASRLTVVTPDAFAGPKADPQIMALWRARLSGGCPVLAWGVHDIDADLAERLAEDLARTAGVDRRRIRVRTVSTAKMIVFGASKTRPSAFVFERAS